MEFVVRARAAPVDPERFRSAIGQGLGVEYLAGIIRQALFVAQDHRDNVTLNLVLEKSQDFSRCLRIAGDTLGSVDNLHENALLNVIIEALAAGAGLAKDASATDSRGIEIMAISFETLVKRFAIERPTFVLAPGGEDIREAEVTSDAVFVMTDHTPMPKNTYKSMARQGVLPLSLGPKMLHADQCITIIHNELDRRFAG